MATIIDVGSLPQEVVDKVDPALLQVMLDAVNATASRVAPCLVDPDAMAWSSSTDYEVEDQVVLSGGEFLEATVAGTSDTVEPSAPTLGKTVTDGTVTWQRIAPTDAQLAEAKLILIAAVVRWSRVGVGGITTEQAGPFSLTHDTSRSGGYNLWPSEIGRLQDICAGDDDGAAFSIDTAPCMSAHLPWCSLEMGATYCSCGVDIAGHPIYEL